jgi:hypothetical protein
MAQMLTVSHKRAHQSRPRDRYLVDRMPRERSVAKPPKTPQIRDDKETAFVHQYLIVMMVLAIAPLIALHFVNYFCPELLLTPITPN